MVQEHHEKREEAKLVQFRMIEARRRSPSALDKHYFFWGCGDGSQ